MDSINKLLNGNKRFVKGKSESHNFYNHRFELIKEQKPYVAILGCSDSRVPLEIIFDENFGSIFAIRNPGNIADNSSLGSIEFAIEALNIKTVLVLGHESCGMIKAAAENQKSKSNYVNRMIQNAKFLIKKVNIDEDSKNGFRNLIKENILNNIHRIKEKSQIVKERLEKNELRIFGGFYNFSSGKVDFYIEENNKLKEYKI